MKYLIATLALVAFSAANAQDKGELIDKVVAVVGNEIVLLSEIESQALQYKEQGMNVGQTEKGQILEDLLFQKLLVHHAKIDSLEVGDAAVQSEIERRLEYFIQVFGSIEAFEEYFGQSVAQWKSELRDPIEEQLLAQQMQGQIDSRVRSTPAQVNAFYDKLPSDSIPLINAEIQYAMIELKPSVREDEKERTRQFLDSIRTLVSKGEMPMDLAAFNYSEDPGSKYKGGCYEAVRRGQFVPEYEAAVFMAGEGAFTPVFESDFGYHFVQVNAIRGEVYNSCHVLMKPKVSDADVIAAQAKMDSVLAAIKDERLSFKQAAIRYSTNEESANQGGIVSNPQTGGNRHDVTGIDPKVFFILDKLEPGELSTPSLLTDEDGVKKFVVYKLVDRIDAHRANLQLDYLLFQRQAEDELREEALSKWIRKKLAGTYIWFNEDVANLPLKNRWVSSEG